MTEFSELPDREILTLQEVAKFLRITDLQACNLCRTGHIGGAFKPGGRWRIVRAKFVQWIEVNDRGEVQIKRRERMKTIQIRQKLGAEDAVRAARAAGARI